MFDIFYILGSIIIIFIFFKYGRKSLLIAFGCLIVAIIYATSAIYISINLNQPKQVKKITHHKTKKQNKIKGELQWKRYLGCELP